MSDNYLDQFLYKPGANDSRAPLARAPEPEPEQAPPVQTPPPTSSQPASNQPLVNAILNASRPLEIPRNDELVRVNGEVGFLANKEELDNWKGETPLHAYPINDDPEPEVIRKKTDQVLVYDQEVVIRYLRPATPPPPGDIILKEDKNIPTPPAPPLVIRQQPPRPETPPPVVIREAPPEHPPVIPPKVITISGKKLPPPPRKVVVERLPLLPTKPAPVMIERWLPYTQPKRRVIFQKNTVPDPVITKPKNVIIQWEPPAVQVRKDFKDLGIIRANPQEYAQRYADQIKPASELPQFVREIKPPAGTVLAADYRAPERPELEGDVAALNLIDLDREGLSEYKNVLNPYQQRAPEPPKPQPEPNFDLPFIFGLLAQVFARADTDSNGKISRPEGARLLRGIHNSLAIKSTDAQIEKFLDEFDENRDGVIDFDEFKKGSIKKYLNNASSLTR